MNSFRPGYPVSASRLNEIDRRSATNSPPTEDGIEYEESSGGTGRIPPEKNPLVILKITGTTTGGYTFTEQYDHDADGTYTDNVQGLDSSSGFYLVPKSGITLATNDIVVARRNPRYWERYEMICYLGSGSTTNSLSFNTGTRDLTSTVNGVAAVANIPAGSGGSLTSYTQAVPSQDLTSITVGTWTSLSTATITITIPGTYLFTWSIGIGIFAAMGSTPAEVYGRLYDGTNPIIGTEGMVFYDGSNPTFGRYFNTMQAIITFAGSPSLNVTLQVYKSMTTPTALSLTLVSDTFRRSALNAIKIA